MKRFRIAALLLFFINPAKADLPGNMVAKYSFNNGNAKDEAGSNHAKISDAILVEDRFNNPRSAYFLYGNLTSYINLGTSKVLKPRKGTISMWFNIYRAESKGSGYHVNPLILTKNLQADDYYEGYGISYELVRGDMSVATAIDSTRQVTCVSVYPLKLHTWHHVVVAYDDDFMSVYLDGKGLNDGQPLKKGFASVFSPTDSVMVGYTANKKNDRCFCGTVDDIYIYDRVLSKDEILALYHEPDYNRNSLYVRIALWGLGIVVFVAITIWLLLLRYRKRLRLQEEQNRVNARLNELETKAIRSQMNPHFIFNSLNTLQHFILEENFSKSNLYLTKLSSLLRRLIESSLSDLVSLSDEVEILTSYIEIESMRFDNSFRYEVKTDVLQPDEVYIPFMLVQPFVENAIWHGLLPKQGDRFVSVHFSEPDKDGIVCVIEDNGIGRRNTSDAKSPFRRKSVAIEFIRQRLELLQKSTGIASSVEITDTKDAQGNVSGTRVIVKIPKLKYENPHHNY